MCSVSACNCTGRRALTRSILRVLPPWLESAGFNISNDPESCKCGVTVQLLSVISVILIQSFYCPVIYQHNLLFMHVSIALFTKVLSGGKKNVNNCTVLLLNQSYLSMQSTASSPLLHCGRLNGLAALDQSAAFNSIYKCWKFINSCTLSTWCSITSYS